MFWRNSHSSKLFLFEIKTEFTECLRIIKLQPNYVAKGKYQKSFTIRPKLTLTGKWLEEVGFKPSKLVQVECRSNQLIITSIE